MGEKGGEESGPVVVLMVGGVSVAVEVWFSEEPSLENRVQE